MTDGTNESENPFQGEESPLFTRAVVAAAFSPRLAAVLNEAHRLAAAFDAQCVIVHVGEKSTSVRTRLEQELAASAFGVQTAVVIETGNPAEALIKAAKEHGADLIIAGALAKEGLFTYYVGSVARTLARHAHCSVLLLTEPHVKQNPFDRIHCAVEYRPGAEKAVVAAAQLADALSSRNLYYTHSFVSAELTSLKSAEDTVSIRRIYRAEEEKLAAFLNALSLPYSGHQMRCLHDPDRSMALKFTRDIGADLFVIHGPTDRVSLWNRLFPHELEATLQHLPCSLLLTR